MPRAFPLNIFIQPLGETILSVIVLFKDMIQWEEARTRIFPFTHLSELVQLEELTTVENVQHDWTLGHLHLIYSAHESNP